MKQLYIWNNETIPEGTDYRILCNREDLFDGKKIIESKSLLNLPIAPSTYPNKIKISSTKCIEKFKKCKNSKEEFKNLYEEVIIHGKQLLSAKL